MNDSKLRQFFLQKKPAFLASGLAKVSARVSTVSTIVATLAVTALVAGCGGALNASIGGSVAGLSGGTTVVLLNNGTNALTVGANGTFTFSTQITAGNTYDVTVETQPVGETCTVTNASGTVSNTCDATTTASNYVLGTLSGLGSGKTVVLSDGTDTSYTVSANSAFVFPTALSAGTAYSVTVVTNPSGQTCTVTNGSGTMPSSGTITTVVIACQ